MQFICILVLAVPFNALRNTDQGPYSSGSIELEADHPEEEAYALPELGPAGCCLQVNLGLDVTTESISAELTSSMPSTAYSCSGSTELTKFVFLEEHHIRKQLSTRPRDAAELCAETLDSSALLYELGALLHASTKLYPVGSWMEAVLLEKSGPGEFIGSDGKVAPCSGSPAYSKVPSQFLAWFGCQDFNHIELLASTIGIEILDDKNKLEQKVFIQLKFDLEESAVAHLTWGRLLVEQALRDAPESQLAADSNLPSVLVEKLRAVVQRLTESGNGRHGLRAMQSSSAKATALLERFVPGAVSVKPAATHNMVKPAAPVAILPTEAQLLPLLPMAPSSEPQRPSVATGPSQEKSTSISGANVAGAIADFGKKMQKARQVALTHLVYISDHGFFYADIPDLAPSITGRHALLTDPITIAQEWSPFVTTLHDKHGTWAVSYEQCEKYLNHFDGQVHTIDFPREWGTETATYPTWLKFDPPAQTGKALFLTPKADHNGAFRLNDKLCEWIGCWEAKGMGLEVRTVSSAEQALQIIESYPTASLDHVVLSGHGSPQSLGWGEGHPTTDGLFMNSPMTNKVMAALKNVVTSDGSVAVDACETGMGSEHRHANELKDLGRGVGTPKNLFESIKMKMGARKVYAPTRSYSVGDYYSAANFQEGVCTPDAREHSWESEYGDLGRVVSALQTAQK
eukprot:TRINITY_DN9912_c0_g2_i1.p1 TRINITY_DN9912_c0_g2~~TRINITY_DN9912_c0_g2_i1.p1  ORF type:complete len:686 (-),score=109.62 TRINITY_DN9912_c0_g2_i1:111-2168(-)